jgi:hypothetical protein
MYSDLEGLGRYYIAEWEKMVNMTRGAALPPSPATGFPSPADYFCRIANTPGQAWAQCKKWSGPGQNPANYVCNLSGRCAFFPELYAPADQRYVTMYERSHNTLMYEYRHVLSTVQ